MQIFEYGQREIEYLKSRDKKLGKAIEKIGMIEREINPEPFAALVSSVVSQQISNKAEKTVCSRLLNLLGNITPEKQWKNSGTEKQWDKKQWDRCDDLKHHTCPAVFFTVFCPVVFNT